MLRQFEQVSSGLVR